MFTLNNDGGAIRFDFTDAETGEVTTLDNPSSGEYAIPLEKGKTMKLLITASKAIGAYKIVRKTVKE